MEIPTLYRAGVTFLLVAAALTFPILLAVTAPYGRHTRSGWGPSLPARVAWLVMEMPAPLGFLLVYAAGPASGDLVPLVFLGLWQAHYVHRSFVYPFLLRGAGRSTPLATAALAFFFNALNGPLNALAVSRVEVHARDWLSDPRFVAGTALFALGFGINLHSDAVLRGLRRPGETGYRIPRRGLYRWVSGANYLGEIVEWCGWALATWSAAGAAFALFTAANLVPRALANHRWYRERFPDYPPERKAILPGIL